MSEKDIKTKPKTTTKSVNALKAVSRSPAETVKDIKIAAKDTFVRNAVDKQRETHQPEQPQRAEVEATQQVESAYYSDADTVYQKGKSFEENKLKQHRQQVKTRESQNADIPHTPQNEGVPEVQNSPKQTNNAPKTKESVQADKSVSALKETPKPQSKVTAQVKTKEAYIQAQKVESKTADKTADTVKTKTNYIKQHKTAEAKDGIKQKLSVSAPKTRENTAPSDSAVPKTKEQAVTDARKKYISEKLKIMSDIEKAAQEGLAEGVMGIDYQPKRTDMFSANENIPKQQTQAVKSEIPTPKVKTENSIDTAFSSKSIPKTKERYIRSQGKTSADIIKTPDSAKAVPKQNTHTVTKNLSSNAKKAVKTKNSFSNGASRAVKTGNRLGLRMGQAKNRIRRGQQNGRN